MENKFVPKSNRVYTYQASYQEMYSWWISWTFMNQKKVQKVWIKSSVNARIVKGKPQKYFGTEFIDFLTFEYLY